MGRRESTRVVRSRSPCKGLSAVDIALGEVTGMDTVHDNYNASLSVQKGSSAPIGASRMNRTRRETLGLSGASRRQNRRDPHRWRRRRS